MEETIKNRIILILAIFSLLFFMGTISSCGNARRNRLARDKEMAMRLDLEEKMNQLGQEKTTTEQSLNNLSGLLEGEKASHEVTGKALADAQMANKNLKEELDKLTKLKEQLEEDLKDALVKNKAVKSKK